MLEWVWWCGVVVMWCWNEYSSLALLLFVVGMSMVLILIQESFLFYVCLTYDQNLDPDNSTTEVAQQKILKNVKFRADGSMVCTICGKIAQRKRTKKIINQHMETHMDGVLFPCENCGKSFRFRNSLRCRKSVYHKAV